MQIKAIKIVGHIIEGERNQTDGTILAIKLVGRRIDG